MKHTIKRLLALALSTAMVCSLMSLPALGRWGQDGRHLELHRE